MEIALLIVSQTFTHINGFKNNVIEHNKRKKEFFSEDGKQFV